LGAEFTQVYAARAGREVKPDEYNRGQHRANPNVEPMSATGIEAKGPTQCAKKKQWSTDGIRLEGVSWISAAKRTFKIGIEKRTHMISLTYDSPISKAGKILW
jgi:hypothetical protein